MLNLVTKGLTKIFGAAIILSERTLKALRDAQRDYGYRYLGKVKVKGKDKAIRIYDLYEGEPVAIRELKAQTKIAFETAINHYHERKFGKAAEIFKQIIEVNETDTAAKYYLDKSVQYIVNRVPEDWTGVEVMTFK